MRIQIGVQIGSYRSSERRNQIRSDSSEPVRDLGVLLDSELTMDAHIKQLCRSCFYQLRRLQVIRHCLSRGTLLTLACAFICNRIDYCNGVLYGVTASRLDRLQSALNATARLVLIIPKFSHISLAIRDELRWLPVQCRSQYKICILVRNSIVGSSPPYLQKLCLPVASVLGRQHLRTAGRNDLLVPQFRTVNYGLRGFSISGPRLWNTLPHDKQLETWTFTKMNLKRTFFNCNSVTSASADPRHKWRFIKCPITLHYITLQIGSDTSSDYDRFR